MIRLRLVINNSFFLSSVGGRSRKDHLCGGRSFARKAFITTSLPISSVSLTTKPIDSFSDLSHLCNLLPSLLFYFCVAFDYEVDGLISLSRRLKLNFFVIWSPKSFLLDFNMVVIELLFRQVSKSGKPSVFIFCMSSSEFRFSFEQDLVYCQDHMVAKIRSLHFLCLLGVLSMQLLKSYCNLLFRVFALM